jgi:fucose permease
MNSTQPASTIQSPSEQGRLRITAAYYAAFIGLGLTNASLGPLLPLLADQARVDLSQVSILFTGRWLGYLLGSLLGGRIYDRRSGHPVMAVSLILVATAMALTSTIPLLWGLVLIMILLGASEASLDVGGNTLLIWLHGRKVAPFMNGLHFFFGLGALISPLIIAQAALAYGQFAWALWLIALVLLPVAFILLRLPSPPRPAYADPVENPASTKLQSESSRKRWLIVFLFVLFFLTAIGAEQSFGGWIYTFAVAAGLATAQMAAILTSVFWGAFTLSRLGSILIANRLSTRAYVFISLLGCTLSLLLLNTLRFLGSEDLGVAVLWLGTILFGISIAVVFPMMLSYAGERTQIFGQVTGLFFVGVSAGGMLIPWLIGQFFESAGPYSTMVILLLAILASIGLFGLIDRRTRLL